MDLGERGELFLWYGLCEFSACFQDFWSGSPWKFGFDLLAEELESADEFVSCEDGGRCDCNVGFSLGFLDEFDFSSSFLECLFDGWRRACELVDRPGAIGDLFEQFSVTACPVQPVEVVEGGIESIVRFGRWRRLRTVEAFLPDDLLNWWILASEPIVLSLRACLEQVSR